MAAVHPHNPSRTHTTHSRLRSSSDPFSDPSTRHRPPPPPPKSVRPSTATKMPTAVPKDVHDITEAVRDTVVVRDHSDSPRTRVGRSQTAVPPPSNSRPNAKRSQSEDNGQLTEVQRSTGKARGKKSSQHADVIDRLDFTGVGLFHHDGPFDACAPSRNKQRSKAPMYAWSNAPDPTQYGDSAYPSAHAYAAFTNDYPEPPKKKVDAIAEAWGIHEPEPYEEFFAGGGSTRPDGDTPASSIYNGRDSHNNPNSGSRSGVPKRGKDEPQSAKDLRSRGPTRRSLMPPPQPIFVPDPTEVLDAPSSYSPSATGSPKRQKSLMQRIRKMRDAPNVPVSAEYEQQPPSPNSPLDYPLSPTRPTHKSQNSFLGRFGGKVPPQSAALGIDRSEPFVLIDPQPSNNKDLPPPPALGATSSGESGAVPEFGGISRKTSIMKKMGRVVRGNK